MTWRFFASTCLLACLAYWWSAGRSIADKDDPLALLRAIAPSYQGRPLDPRAFEVNAWVLGQQRQRERKPIKVRALFAFGDTCYVAEEGTSRWLVGLVPRQGKTIDCENNFESLEDLLKAAAFPALPRPPEGFTLRELARVPGHPSRLASDGSGRRLYILSVNGDVYRVIPSQGPASLKQVLRNEQYLDPAYSDRMLVGMTLDAAGRLYLVANMRDEMARPITNRVVIYRTTAVADGDPVDPEPWLKVSYPWGIGPFNHGVGHLAFGPDGMLYVNSGSRTDGNETGNDPRYSREGETPLTACLWRIDPNADKPKVEVYARGLRNAYGFCWNDKGEMFATDNGPDADPPEELNLIEQGKHYGFPYRFSNWPRKPYPHTPTPPTGQDFVLPIANLGPAGGGSAKEPLYTFDPHSSPSGIVYLGDDFPTGYRGSFLVARFGNLLDKPRVGFDVLQMTLTKDGKGAYTAQTKTLLAPVARPVDLHLSGKGKMYVCEYSRQLENKGYAGMLPGRVLELAVKPGQ